MPVEIHIAGTNGKGSVASKIAASITNAGYRCGLFTSPHIFDPRERIQIDGQKIPHLNFTNFADSFDIARDYFQSCDYAVYEAGIGGRLDATNVLNPILTIITSIGLDHCELLGSTLHEIAREKAGIVKPGIPLVLGPTAQCYGIKADRIINVESHSDYRQENIAIAKAALDELKIPATRLDATPPCRFQKIGTTIFDVAHNLPALERLFDLVPPLRTLLALSRKLPGPLSREVIPIHSDHPRILPLGTHIDEIDITSEPTLITGSCYIMESAIEKLEKEHSLSIRSESMATP